MRQVFIIEYPQPSQYASRYGKAGMAVQRNPVLAALHPIELRCGRDQLIKPVSAAYREYNEHTLAGSRRGPLVPAARGVKCPT